MATARKGTTIGRRAALGAALALAIGGVTALPATASPKPVPRTEKASVAPDGTEGNKGSSGQSLSANGRYLAFVSAADNLVKGDTNGVADAFVRDLKTGTTRLVSTAADGGLGDGSVFEVSLSADGRYLAFSSRGNYTSGDTGGHTHVWVKNLKTGAIQRLRDSFDTGYDSGGQPAISADGRYVAFVAQRSDPTPVEDGRGRVYRVDRVTGAAVRISQIPEPGAAKSSAGKPSISADGSRVGYQFFIPFPSRYDWSDVYVRDVPSGELIQVDKAPDGAVSDGHTEYMQVSANGR
ncbi:TolB family protein [Streptomyces sp. NPDC002577]